MDLDRLLKLRLIVARHGEMDGARWWDTQGLLGPRGSTVMRRGFPRSHPFAQARVVFEVARMRCREVYNAPGSTTLWQMPAAIEDAFDAQWPAWLEQEERWRPFFDWLAELRGEDLCGALSARGLLSEAEAQQVARLPRVAEGRAVQVGEAGPLSTTRVTLLAAAFSRGDDGKPAVPYVHREG